MSIEAMKQALEALEDNHEEIVHDWSLFEKNKKAIIALRQAIQEEALRNVARLGQEIEQEPVAWRVHPFDYGIGHEGVYAKTDSPEQVEAWKRKGWNVQPLYTHPPKRERVFFPTMLRKMWSGGEVQEWLDKNVNKENT